MPRAALTSEHDSPTLPANEPRDNPTAPRNRAVALGQGIALTAIFVATLIKRAYGPPYPIRTPRRPAPQHPIATPHTIPHPTPRH